MVIDHTLIELSYTGDTLTMIVQINLLERRAIKFTPEAFTQFLADCARTEASWRRDRQTIIPEYYTILGVSRSASAEEIQQAYRTRAKQDHPDTSARDTTTAMQALNEAYAVLGDPQQRQHYDRTA